MGGEQLWLLYGAREGKGRGGFLSFFFFPSNRPFEGVFLFMCASINEIFDSLCPAGREPGGGSFLGLFRWGSGVLSPTAWGLQSTALNLETREIFLLISCTHAFVIKARSRITVSTQRPPRLTWPDRTGRTDRYRLCRNRSGTQEDLRPITGWASGAGIWRIRAARSVTKGWSGEGKSKCTSLLQEQLFPGICGYQS